MKKLQIALTRTMFCLALAISFSSQANNSNSGNSSNHQGPPGGETLLEPKCLSTKDCLGGDGGLILQATNTNQKNTCGLSCQASNLMNKLLGRTLN